MFWPPQARVPGAGLVSNLFVSFCAVVVCGEGFTPVAQTIGFKNDFIRPMFRVVSAMVEESTEDSAIHAFVVHCQDTHRCDAVSFQESFEPDLGNWLWPEQTT